MKFLKKYHKWLSIFFTFFILLFSVSGIILNHRELFSNFDVSRSILPKEYRYSNWNNAAIAGTLKLSKDSILIYGNVGIWLTDSIFTNFKSFNNGFEKGIDNRKISKIIVTNKKELLAASYFGVFKYNSKKESWQKIKLPVIENRIADLIQKNDTNIILTRSFLLKTTNFTNFEVQTLPKPENYDNKIGLFKTLWVIHSGEIYGLAGKILVDIVGLIFGFLSVTGFIIFINKVILKKNGKSDIKKNKLVKSIKWNLKWHNKIGWTTVILLIITTFTGMFLRPPLLIPIANAKVGKIPYTELDSPNAWLDKLRRISFDSAKNRYVLATSDGFFYSDDDFKSSLKMFDYQPPASVMGVTVFEQIDSTNYLIGSFEGLFKWNTETGEIVDYITQQNYVAPKRKGAPIGQYLITGFTSDYKNEEVIFEYNGGAFCLFSNSKFPKMPQIIENQRISIWNLSQEIHTGRIFQSVIGIFYILVVPFVGFVILFILISGFIIWYKIYRKRHI
jgi:hypothetical protein